MEPTQNTAERPRSALPQTEPRKGFYDQYRGKNLKFIIDLLTALNIGPQEFGTIAGQRNNYSTQLRSSLIADDMKLSKAKRLLSYIGYGFTVKMYIERTVKAPDETDNVLVRLPEKLKLELVKDDGKQLFFLKEFMAENKLSQQKLAEAIGVTQPCIKQWFKGDDIRISYITRIKETYGAKVEYTIVPLEKV